MTADFPIYKIEDDPRNTLVDFMETVRIFLNDIVGSNLDSLGQPILFEELREDVVQAWNDAIEHFHDATKYVMGLGDKHLYEHGLYGAQLRLKTRIVQHFARRYERQGKRLLKPLLDVIDDLLDSMLEGVPGGGAVKEMKDAIRNCVSE